MYPTETVTLIPLQFIENKFPFLAHDQYYLDNVSFGDAKHTLIPIQKFLELVAAAPDFTDKQWNQVYDSFEGHDYHDTFVDLEQ